MLRSARVYIYVVDRDFGFAPNPFHGCCTLATCKPDIRKGAKIGDWVVGVGGSRLEATGHCIYAMRISGKITFSEYWNAPDFFDKRPVRNGSRKMMVGDNIYRFDVSSAKWHQVDSHHSNADGTINTHNLATDTKTDAVLFSRHFYYFGKDAPKIPQPLLDAIDYKNGRRHRVFEAAECAGILTWLETEFVDILNFVAADPFDFERSEKRYSIETNRVT